MVERKKDRLVISGLSDKQKLFVAYGLMGFETSNEGGNLVIHATLGELRANRLYVNEINWCGNKKLVNNADVKYIIWNIPAVRTCPFATAQCKKSCYALKAERVYPNVKKSRERALELSKNYDFDTRMIYTLIVEIYCTNKYKDVKQIRYRIHESGDFYNLKYVEKWMGIIKAFQIDNRIVFDCYTKSLLFFGKYNAIDGEFPGYKNLKFKASVWADTEESQLKMIKDHNYRVYTAGTIEEVNQELKKNKNAVLCGCSDCANCGYCVDNAIKKMLCVIH